MKRTVAVLSALGILGIAIVVGAHEGHKHTKQSASAAVKTPTSTASAKVVLPAASVVKVDLTGELIDPQCWFTHNGEGKNHASCAIKCAKGGQDLAFFDGRTGEVHTLIAMGHGTNPNDGLYGHVGVPVRVRGTLYKRGVNSGLIVENVEQVK